MELMKFYEQASFKKLHAKWREKLAQSGFNDIEDKNESLKDYDRRTSNFEDRDSVLEFFLLLDDFLRDAEIPRKHRRVLELYSSGIHNNKEISVKVNMSYAWVKLILVKYEKIILDRD